MRVNRELIKDLPTKRCISLSAYLHRLFESEEDRLQDKTDFFFDKLRWGIEKGDILDDFSFNATVRGVGGSGKSGLSFEICNQTLTTSLESNKDWKVLLFRAPQRFLDLIRAKAPSDIGAQFQIVQNLNEFTPHSIVYFDEAILALNLMNYRDKWIQNFLNGLTFARHKDLIFLANSVDDGVLYRYLTRTHFTFYKTHSDEMIERNRNDAFLDQFAEKISKLKPNETLFRTSFKYFVNSHVKRGLIDAPLENYCSWFDKELSKYMSESIMDQRFVERQRQQAQIEDTIQEIVQKYPSQLMNARGKAFLEGYFQRERPEFYEMIQENVSDIYKQAVYLISLSKNRDTSEKAQNLPVDQLLINKNWIFPRFLRENITDEIQAELAELTNTGLSQNQIAKSMKKSLSWVNQMIQFYAKRRFGYYFQQYWDLLWGGSGENSGDNHLPDWIDEKGKIFEPNYAYSIKWCNIYKNKIDKYKQTADMGPEFDWAKKNRQRYYYAVMYNAAWSTCIYIKKIFLDDPETIIFDKSAFQQNMKKTAHDTLQILTDF